MLLFALELHRRARAAGLGLLSIPIHPGIAHTDIFQRTLSPSSLRFRLSAFVMKIVAQSAAQGALPILFAATAPQAESGTYYGPNGLLEDPGVPGRRAPGPPRSRSGDGGSALEGLRAPERRDLPPRRKMQLARTRFAMMGRGEPVLEGPDERGI